MEPERVRAYLQAACAGLGFDIGEVWWTSSENGSSTVATIEEPAEDNGALVNSSEPKKKLRFVQLYTSKSYEDRRSELVNPPDAEGSAAGPGGRLQRTSSTENLEKHVLSPLLVDAISKTTQVVWATTKKEEGLIGRSDIRLQTAVGMPVAMDGNGNMCVVVMFSHNNIQSNDDAVEYLQSISQSATSSSIPCLLPVIDPRSSSGLQPLPHTVLPHPDESSLGEGVTARFVSLDDCHCHGGSDREDNTPSPSTEPEVHSEHELSAAPKDTFGIPMLPSFAELGDANPEETIDAFDEASYGIWTTIMETLKDLQDIDDSSQNLDLQMQMDLQNDSTLIGVGDPSSLSSLAVIPGRVDIDASRKERLEEFCSAFLGLSVFDLADVWVPVGGENPDCLRHVMSVSSAETNVNLDEFKHISENTLIKFWNGAVGRAYSSGNPVWSANPNVFVDPGRAAGFQKAKIMTVLAVPVFSAKEILPTCVVSCYSLVRSSSVPFVLRFVQQALRLLWHGLDSVEPHESVGKRLWRDVAPADLGEMAADVEMQQHFITKKRPRSMSVSLEQDPRTSQLSSQLQQISLPNGDTITVPLQLTEDVPVAGVSGINVETVQSHIYEAVRSVGDAVPFDHVATNAEGTKRAHVIAPSANTPNFATQPVDAPAPAFQSIPIQNPAMNVPVSFTTPQPSLKSVPVDQSKFAPLNGAASAAQVVIPAAGMDNANQYCIPMNGYVPVAVPAADFKLCRIQGCSEPAVSRRPYCTRHSGNRLCEHPGCTKCAQGATRFCIAHGGGRRCTFPGCDKGARDKFFCAAHGGGKRCKHEGCTKSAVGGSSLCTAHGGGRRCAANGCTKSAQSSTKFCVKHGGGKKCAQEGCQKVARGRTLYCAAHGGGVRCKLEGCNRVAIGKMQLCRAHGGGSGLKKNVATVSLSPSLPPASQTMPQQVMSQQNAILMNETPAGVTVDQMTSV